MRSVRIFGFLSAAAALWLGAPAAANDLYREPVCLGLHGDRAAESGRTLVKLLRWPHALEQPFHLLPDRALGNGRELDASTRALFHGHSGVVLEGPDSSRWNADIEVQAAFARGPLPGSPLCQSGVEFNVPEARITTDPYTGNLFVGRFREPRFELAIFDPSGELLVDVRTDLFFRSPLPDLTGTPHAEVASSAARDYFWFAREQLAGFVDVYRRIGGASYARFLVDAFVSELIYRDRAFDGEAAGPRLPYLPGPDSSVESLVPQAVDNLRGLRTTYRQVFIRGKPRKGGVSCALMPVLKMIEDRDCRAASDPASVPLEEGSCPAYSAMALQTELFREHPETMRFRGYALSQVFETLVAGGLCSGDSYPMLTDVGVGRTTSVEQFGARAEQELNRILGTRGDEPALEYREFLERTPDEELTFVEQLPPACREEMAAYRETHPLAPHELVELLTTQSGFQVGLSKERIAELMRAQKEELFLLVVRLLREGLLVGVAGDQGSLKRHAVLAYGWDRNGFLLMDSDLPDEAARRRTVMPAKELLRTLSGVSYLRGEVGQLRPTVEQLSASLRLLPDIAWTHRRLAELYREQGRHRDAVEHLRRTVELEPDRANSWLDLGESLQVIGRFEEALEATSQAIELGGDEPYAQAQLGYSLRKLGRLDEAEQALRAAVNPQHSWEWRQLGWTLFDLGRDEEAELCFRRAVEIAPGQIWNHVKLAELLAGAGKPDEAREVLLAAARGDFDPSERTWIGTWLGLLGRFDEALPLLESVLEAEPDNHTARLALARLFRQRGETERLLTLLEPMLRELAAPIESGTADLQTRIDLAYAQALTGGAGACRATIAPLEAGKEALEGNELYDLACVQALNGERERALASLEAALRRGFDDYRWARRDPDLASLTDDPRLENLLAQYGGHER